MEHREIHPGLGQLLSGMKKFDASDLHLKVGYTPYYRVVGDLRKLDMPPIKDSEELEEMVLTIIPSSRMEEYEERGDLDFSYRGEHGEAAFAAMYFGQGEK